MVFKYSQRAKRLALQNDECVLKEAYKESEKRLNSCARKGSYKDLSTAMKMHQDFEYALLYRNSPEFKKKMKTRRRK